MALPSIILLIEYSFPDSHLSNTPVHLQQYHLVDKKPPDVTNANCWAHARRDFANAVKAADKKDPSSVRQSVAYQALQKIAEFYNADTELKGLSSRQRLQKRQEAAPPITGGVEFNDWRMI